MLNRVTYQIELETLDVVLPTIFRAVQLQAAAGGAGASVANHVPVALEGHTVAYV
jgi:hypothetical protein